VSGSRWTTDEVTRALGVAPERGPRDAVFGGVSTDSRALGAGELFVALTGERFDAHTMLGAAAGAGATGAVVSRIPGDAPDGLSYFVVPDTLTALAWLGRHRRRSLGGRVVAVAGSNGKTTTKDIVKAVLSARFRVHATEGNLNNQIGLPLTLLGAPDDAEALVLEVGTNTPGEIAILTSIAEPHDALITSIGEEHLEKLVDVEGVLIEETSLLVGLPPDGVALVAEEPAELAARAAKLVGPHRLRTAGLSPASDLHPEGGAAGVEMLPDGRTRWRWEGHEVELPLRGRHNVRNALLALGLAREWGVDPGEAVRALREMPAPKLRGEWKSVGRMRVIADCYNSNPASLTAALDLLTALPSAGARVAVVGTMREMGPRAAELHRRSADALAGFVGRGVDRIVATGAFVEAFSPLADALGGSLVLERDPVAAYDRVAGVLRGDETILLKASRGEALERWLPLLERDWGAAETRPTDG
jgi:UDP-N-acetylmuramoyl-tripeptide--D-alanyl-D-alanine ligase